MSLLGGRTFKVEGSITLEVSAEINIIPPFRADELAKFIRALMRLSRVDEKNNNNSELRGIGQLVRVLTCLVRKR